MSDVSNLEIVRFGRWWVTEEILLIGGCVSYGFVEGENPTEDYLLHFN